MSSAGVDAHLVVQGGLESGLYPTLGDTPQVVFGQGDMNDVFAVVAAGSVDFSADPETGQHSTRVVIGPPTDVRRHTRNRLRSECPSTEFDAGLLDAPRIGSGDQKMHLPPVRGHRRDVSLDDLGTVLCGELTQNDHSGVDAVRGERGIRVNVDAHHRSSHEAEFNQEIARVTEPDNAAMTLSNELSEVR